jgi:hypothetical protein
MRIAWELKLPLEDVAKMTPEHFCRWVAFFQLMDEARSKGKRRGA